MSAPPESLLLPLQVNAMAWDPVLTPKGYQQLTSLSGSTALTVPTGARVAMIQAEDQNVRYRDDGTAPTGSVGMVLAAGDAIWFNADLTAVRFIQAAAGAKLNVLYYGAAD